MQDSYIVRPKSIDQHRWAASDTPPQLLAALACGVAGGLLAAQIPRDLPSGGLELGAAGLFAAFLGLFAISLQRLVKGDWFHPWAFPMLYVATCCALPIVFLVALREPLANPAISPFDISQGVIAVFGITLVAVAAGVATGLRFRPLARRAPAPDIDFRDVLQAGRILLLTAIGARLFVFVTTIGLPYGYGSVAFGAGAALEAIASVVVLAGTVVVVVSNLRLSGRTFSRVDVALLGVFALATLFVGSRGELLAPALFALWAHHTYVRKLRFAPIAAAAIAILVVFQGVSGTRLGEPFYASPKETIQRSLGSIATPVQVQSLLMRRVPSPEPYRGGSTYVASVVRQAPGPIANAVLGPPDDTATFEFRNVLNFTSPNSGLGFSLPSEGYINFGLLGVALAALALGLLLGWSSKQQVDRPSRAIHLLYGLVIATLPIAFRSDAVEQIKLILYPLLILTVILYVCRRPRDAGFGS